MNKESDSAMVSKAALLSALTYLHIPLMTKEDLFNTLSTRLVGLKPSYEQYIRNMLWPHLLISLIKERHQLTPFSLHQLENVRAIIKSEARKYAPSKHANGDLYLYLRKLLQLEAPWPTTLKPYKIEVVLSISYLVGMCDELCEKLPLSLQEQAQLIAKKDIAIYLANCVK